MVNNIIHNILTSDEIADILNNHEVLANKEKLSTQEKVDFSIELSDEIKAKLGNSFGIDLSQIASIPMRWIKGETQPHIDKGPKSFDNTYLVYLTDSIGNLIVDGNSYPITAGNGHIFSEGLEHYTINNENTQRLLIGPMSEAGFHVGISPFVSFTMNTFTDFYSSGEGFVYIWTYNTPTTPQITIFDLPPPMPDSTPDYIIDNYPNPVNWAAPPGKIFGGWKLMDRPDNYPFDGYSSSDIYMPGETYTFSQYVFLVPNWIDPPTAPICFTANTPIHTDQGIIPIQNIDTKKHTIGNKKIVAITKTISPDDHLICFEKNSIAKNIPCETTMVSKDHLIYHNRNMIKAEEFVAKYKNVHKVEYTGEILYNVLMESYEKINVNNLICETLHPRSAIAQLYTHFSNCNLEEQNKLIKKYNSTNKTSCKKRLMFTKKLPGQNPKF